MLNFLNFLKLSYFHINFIFILFPILYNIITMQYSSVELFQDLFPKAKLISSGKYFIVYSKGFSIYNPNFTLYKTLYNFTSDEIINYGDIEKTFIYEFIKNKISYILCLVKGSTLFVFKSEEFIFKYNIDSEGTIYDLVLYKIENSLLQYIIISIKEKKLTLSFYELEYTSLNENSNNLKYYNNSALGNNELYDDFVSCQKMRLSQNEEVLTCFWVFKYNKKFYLMAKNFAVKNNFNRINYTFHKININENTLAYDIKSSLLFEKSKCFACYIIYEFIDYCIETYDTHCFIYDIKTNILEKMNTSFKDYQKSEIYSFHETNQYAFFFYKEEKYIIVDGICTRTDSEFKLIFINENSAQFDLNSNNEINILLPQGSKINSFSLVFSIEKQKYNIIYDCELFTYYFESIFQGIYTNYYWALLNSSDDSNSNGYFENMPTTFFSYDTAYSSLFYDSSIDVKDDLTEKISEHFYPINSSIDTTITQYNSFITIQMSDNLNYNNLSIESSNIKYNSSFINYISEDLTESKASTNTPTTNILSNINTISYNEIYSTSNSLSSNILTSYLTNYYSSSLSDSNSLTYNKYNDNYNTDSNYNTNEISLYLNTKDTSLSLSFNSDIPSYTNYFSNVNYDKYWFDEKVLNKTKNEIKEIIPSLVSEIEIGKYYKISGNDFSITIKPLNSCNKENSTYADFSNCEQILRKELNIPSSTVLTFLQVEINSNNKQSLVNQVEYQVYD